MGVPLVLGWQRRNCGCLLSFGVGEEESRVSLQFWGGNRGRPLILGGRGGGGAAAEVTLVELPLQALHLRLVPADTVDAFGAQPWRFRERRSAPRLRPTLGELPYFAFLPPSKPGAPL